MTGPQNPQPDEMNSIVLDAAVLDKPVPDSCESDSHAQAGDIDAARMVPVAAREADELVDRHYEAVYRYAYRLSGCAATAEDITQESFVQAIGHLHQLRAREAERGWLLAIARRQFMRVLRKTIHSKHGRMLSIDCPHDEVDAALSRDQSNNREQQSIDNQDCVELALTQLGHDARMIVVMYYFEELSYAEIATQLNIPIGTVMSRLSRSRDSLRKLLDQESADRHSDTASTPVAHPSIHSHPSQEARHG